MKPEITDLEYCDRCSNNLATKTIRREGCDGCGGLGMMCGDFTTIEYICDSCLTPDYAAKLEPMAIQEL